MSKPCPSCGYRSLTSDRQMLARYKKAFGDLPVMEMMKRGWLKCGFTDEHGWPSVDEVRDALKRFAGKDAKMSAPIVCGGSSGHSAALKCRLMGMGTIANQDAS